MTLSGGQGRGMVRVCLTGTKNKFGREKKNEHHGRGLSKARWASPEGQEILEQHFSLKALRAYFQGRPALSAADIDGWRGKETIQSRSLFLSK